MRQIKQRELPVLSLSLILFSAVCHAEMLHPLCLEPFVELQESEATLTSLDLRACQKKHAHLSLQHKTPWQVSFSASEQDISLATDAMPAYARYEIIGQMEDKSVLVNYAINYGGSGTFSMGFLVKGLDTDHWPEFDKALATDKRSSNLELVKTIDGGDRCFGSIEQMVITSPATLQVTRRITPFQLVTLHAEKEPESLNTSDLPDCALCCVGQYTESISLGGQKEVVSIEINGEHLGKNNSQSRQQQCLYKLSGAGSHRQVLNTKQLEELQKNFFQICVTPAKQP